MKKMQAVLMCCFDVLLRLGLRLGIRTWLSSATFLLELTVHDAVSARGQRLVEENTRRWWRANARRWWRPQPEAPPKT
jgi:hypothetical protein